MTATPIPRTLSLTLYGDLDLSVLDEMPPGRGRVDTKFYSRVEESETLDLKAAKEMYQHFAKKEFKEFKVGLVHGQMKRGDAEKVMENFKNKKINILVSTTILEVGVDVPNANLMVIEHAERFGLSQLHQLRGRIGRGSQNALCLLIGEPLTEDSKARIDVICSTTDGFKIAQQDLLISGPGHYFGRH